MSMTEKQYAGLRGTVREIPRPRLRTSRIQQIRMKNRDTYRDTTWYHVVEYDEDVHVALERLRHAIFYKHDFVDAWEFLRSNESTLGEKPRSPDEALEFNWRHYRCGTQSVIDIVRVSDQPPVADRWESGTAYKLSKDEVMDYFGEQEAYADRVEHAMSSLLQSCGCDTARVVNLLNRQNVPIAILFAGVSCD